MPQLDGSSEVFGHDLDNSSEIIFQASNSVRTSFIVLASLNALAGAVAAAGIYWDCCRKSRSHDLRLEFKPSFCKLVGPAETFPFVLSLSIVVQGIIFAVVQGFALPMSRTAVCESISEILLAAFLMIPYMHLTFGTLASDNSDSIFYSKLLLQTTTSPFFYYVSASHGSRTSATSALIQWHLSIAAMVMVNLSGTINGLLYVVLRSTKLGRIGSKAHDEFHPRRSRTPIRSAQRPSLVFAEPTGQPLSMPATLAARRFGSFERPGDIGTTARAAPLAEKKRHGAKNAFAAIEPLAANVSTMSGTYAPVVAQKPTRKSSYSLFPRDDKHDARSRSRSRLMPPAAALAPANHLVTVPPMMRFSGRTRDNVSSLGSSATVPIGLRVSIISDAGPVHPLDRTRPTRASTHRSYAVPLPPMDPDVKTGSRGAKDKQLPPVPLCFTKKPPEKGSLGAQKQPPLPARVHNSQRSAAGGETNAADPERRGHAPSVSNSTVEHQPRVDEAEWI
ncbi:hypothetical protein E4U53_000073 [Claviceps sorghi]|nr:hypothetical protein E4U53_000073 [Claviceps sorghi]